MSRVIPLPHLPPAAVGLHLEPHGAVGGYPLVGGGGREEVPFPAFLAVEQ